jgi:hypothetical protein
MRSSSNITHYTVQVNKHKSNVGQGNVGENKIIRTTSMSRRLNYVQDYSVLYNNAVRPVTIVNMRVNI